MTLLSRTFRVEGQVSGGRASLPGIRLLFPSASKIPAWLFSSPYWPRLRLGQYAGLENNRRYFLGLEKWGQSLSHLRRLPMHMRASEVYSYLSGGYNKNRPFGQLLPGLETGHLVTVSQSPAYESHSEQSEMETRKTAFCSSETLKSYAGDWPTVTGCPVSNPGNNCANGL